MKKVSLIKEISSEELLIEKDGLEFIAVSREMFLIRSFLSACQQGLIGKITSNLIAVTVDWKFSSDNYFLHLRGYFNTEATEEEKEIVNGAFGEIIGHMPNITNLKIKFDVKEEFETLDTNKKIEPLKVFVFLRDRK